MTVKHLGIEFKDEADRDRALADLQLVLDKIDDAERRAQM